MRSITHARRLVFAGVLTLGAASAALAAGAFAPFDGAWRGKGTVSDVNGRSETLTCKSSNSPSQDGIEMSLSLVCASDSYRVDFHADLYTDGQSIHGTWTETTRSASGNLRGQIAGDQIQATASAPGFGANITVHVIGGRRLDVALSATGTSINHVQVSMKK